MEGNQSVESVKKNIKNNGAKITKNTEKKGISINIFQWRLGKTLLYLNLKEFDLRGFIII